MTPSSWTANAVRSSPTCWWGPKKCWRVSTMSTRRASSTPPRPWGDPLTPDVHAGQVDERIGATPGSQRRQRRPDTTPGQRRARGEHRERLDAPVHDGRHIRRKWACIGTEEEVEKYVDWYKATVTPSSRSTTTGGPARGASLWLCALTLPLGRSRRRSCRTSPPSRKGSSCPPSTSSHRAAKVDAPTPSMSKTIMPRNEER